MFKDSEDLEIHIYGRADIKDDDISSLKDSNDGAHVEMKRGGKLPVQEGT